MRYLTYYIIHVYGAYYIYYIFFFSITGEKNGLPQNGNIFSCPNYCATMQFTNS